MRSSPRAWHASVTLPFPHGPLLSHIQLQIHGHAAADSAYNDGGRAWRSSTCVSRTADVTKITRVLHKVFHEPLHPYLVDGVFSDLAAAVTAVLQDALLPHEPAKALNSCARARKSLLRPSSFDPLLVDRMPSCVHVFPFSLCCHRRPREHLIAAGQAFHRPLLATSRFLGCCATRLSYFSVRHFISWGIC
jgi:hypothetical protein